MAINVDPGTPPRAPLARELSPYPTDYRSWKILAWTGPVFLFAVFCLWGIVARNMPPFPASATPEEVKAHFQELRLPLLIALSICLTMTAFYMSFSVAVARVMERIEGPGGVLSKLEMMGGTITCAPVMVTMAIWLTAAHEVNNLDSRNHAHALLVWLAHVRFGVLRHVIPDRRHQHRVHAGQAGEEAGPGRRQLVGLGHLRVVLRGQCHPVRHDRAAGLQRRDQLLDRVLHLVLLDPEPVLLHHQGHPPAPGRGRGRGARERLVSWRSLPPTA